MERHPVKLVTIVAEAVIERDLAAELERLGATGYTITDARGKGHRGVRSSGWEHGANIRMEVVCEAAVAEAIGDLLRERYYDNYAMILFVSDVEVLRPGKFLRGS